MNYVSEEELRQELIAVQGASKLQEITKKLNDLKVGDCEETLLKERELLLSQGFIENYSKTKFAEMILLIVKKRMTSSKFVGYSWKDDFMSLALLHILSYSIKNFNKDYVNPRTGTGSKAFSYVTEIANRSFIAIINERKAENEAINDFISLDEMYDNMHSTQKGEMFAGTPTSKKDEQEKDTHNIEFKLMWKDESLFDGTQKVSCIYDLLREHQGKKIKLIYPLEYKITLEENDKINKLKFDYLNIHKKQVEKYETSFPKKAIKEKEDLINEWE